MNGEDKIADLVREKLNKEKEVYIEFKVVSVEDKDKMIIAHVKVIVDQFVFHLEYSTDKNKSFNPLEQAMFYVTDAINKGGAKYKTIVGKDELIVSRFLEALR